MTTTGYAPSVEEDQRNELLARQARIDELTEALERATERRNAYFVELNANGEGPGATEIAKVLAPMHRVTVQRVLDEERRVQARLRRERGKPTES